MSQIIITVLLFVAIAIALLRIGCAIGVEKENDRVAKLLVSKYQLIKEDLYGGKIDVPKSEYGSRVITDLYSELLGIYFKDE